MFFIIFLCYLILSHLTKLALILITNITSQLNVHEGAFITSPAFLCPWAPMCHQPASCHHSSLFPLTPISGLVMILLVHSSGFLNLYLGVLHCLGKICKTACPVLSPLHSSSNSTLEVPRLLSQRPPPGLSVLDSQMNSSDLPFNSVSLSSDL